MGAGCNPCSLTVKVTDSNNKSDTKPFSFAVYPALQITGGPLHQGEKGVSYGTVGLTAAGGKPGTHTWTLAGATGLGPTSGTGTTFTVSGTPTAAGTAVLTLTDQFNTVGVPQSATVFTNMVLTASPTPQCSKAAGPCTKTIGTLAGGYTLVSVGAGTPPGMSVSISGANVNISGPTTLALVQTYSFSVTVRDGCACTGNGTDVKTLSIQITL
jgi:hypothetical protein